MKSSDLLVKTLENEGVDYIFGVPGEENLDFINSLKNSKIKLVTTRHEQSAGFMAATFGRLTGKTGVCLSTVGPGTTNLITAAAYAQLGGMPMMMITGQKPIKQSKQGYFQIIDTVQMMKSVTKFTKQIIHGENIPALVREAFRKAEAEHPGAVHLELPEDVAKEQVEAKLMQIEKVRRPVAEDKAVKNAVKMIELAKQPLLIIGAGANRKQTSKMLKQFINKTGIPFANTQMGKGVINEKNRLFIGTAALSENDYIHCAIERADLIINIGHDATEKPPFIMHNKHKQQVIHINFFSATVDKIYYPQLEVIGDIANAIWQIKEYIKPQKKWDFSYFLEIKRIIDAKTKVTDSLKRFPLTPQYIVDETRKAMPSDGILALDNGMYKIWFARHYKAHQPNTILLDNALATMGAGLPSAIATKLIYPERKVMAVVGDGGFMMNSQELETAIRLKLDLVILVINDDGFGMIKWKQKTMGFKNFGLSYQNPDFVKYAQSYGAKGYRIEKAEDLKKQLTKCLDKKGVHLIEVPVDYSQNDKILNKELKNKTCPV